VATLLVPESVSPEDSKADCFRPRDWLPFAVGSWIVNRIDGKLTERAAPLEATRNVSFWFRVALLVILVGFLYCHILARLVMDCWTDPNFSHGFLVPVFSGFVLWRNQKGLADLPIEPSWSGLLVVTSALGILVVGVLGAEFFLSRSSFLFLIAGLVIYFLGWRHFRATLFPWVFLFFMVPIPAIIFNQVAFPLQFLAARLAGSLLNIFGVPVLREGNIVQLPGMALEVAQACSGIRSLMSLGALAVIYGYFLETRYLLRILLALAAIPIAVAANALRVMGTGLLGYYWDPDKAEGFFHTFSGWVIFVVSLVLLFSIHALLGWIGAWAARAGGRKT
jgi:exosortase